MSLLYVKKTAILTSAFNDSFELLGKTRAGSLDKYPAAVMCRIAFSTKLVAMASPSFVLEDMLTLLFVTRTVAPETSRMSFILAPDLPMILLRPPSGRAMVLVNMINLKS